MTIGLTAMMGICSLAVDLGRVQLAKTELRRAADAAARAAVAYLPSDTTGGRNAAIAIAAANTVDGEPLVLQASDIVFGRWDSSTGVFDSSSGSPNAVQVRAQRIASRGTAIPLTFARLLGKSSQDLVIEQTTVLVAGTAEGITGLNSVSVGNNTFVSSYNSNTTISPSTSNHTSDGNLLSNGTIAGGNNSQLRGSVTLGPSGYIAGFSITGGTTMQSSALAGPTSPAWAPGTNPGGIGQSYTSSGNTTLAGGTYWFTSLTVNGTLNFSGAATLYVNGNVDVNGTLAAYGDKPANLKIYMLGNRTFGDDNDNNISITADIEAPSSTFYSKNNLVFRGRMVFSAIDVKNNASFFSDQAISSSSDGNIATVQ